VRALQYGLWWIRKIVEDTELPGVLQSYGGPHNASNQANDEK
jgi:hypothetical protein